MNATDIELTAFIDGLAPRARLMGVDLGTKTIGLALSDVELRIATPLETIRRVKFTPDVQQIKALAVRYAVGGLVIGLPLNMDGARGRARRRPALSCAISSRIWTCPCCSGTNACPPSQ